MKTLLAYMFAVLPVCAAHPLALPAEDAAPPEVVAPSSGEVLAIGSERFGTLDEALSPDEDVAQVAARLETADAAFEFVRDKIALQSYPGSMRGSLGSLRAAAGNSMDRALLLQALLREQGRNARLAWARIDEEKASVLLARVTAEPVFIPASTPWFEALAGQAAAAHTPLRNAALDRTAEGIDLNAMHRASLEDLFDHWWVELEQEDGWQVLDTALRDAVPGPNGVEAVEVFDDLPEDRIQHIVLRVVAELAQGDGMIREVCLEHQASVEDFSTSVVVLGRAPEAAGNILAGALGDVMGMGRFTPALRLGGDFFRGSEVILDQPTGSGTGGGLAGALGALTFDAEPATEESPSSSRALVGLVMEIEFHALGGEPVRVRRLLFDKLTGADRHRWESAGHPADMVLEPLASNSIEISAALDATHIIQTYHGAHNPGGWAAMTENLILDLALEYSGDESSAVQLIDGEQWQNLQASLWRSLPIISDLFVTSAVNDLDGVRFFPARPRMAVISHFMAASEPGSGISVDLLHDDLRVAVSQDAAARDIAARQLWRGVLCGALETRLGEFFMLPVKPEFLQPAETATNLRDVRVLVEADMPSDAGIALRSVLASQGVAVVDASGQFSNSFWEIDPQTGSTRAVSEPGLGAFVRKFSLAGFGKYGQGVARILDPELLKLIMDTMEYYQMLDERAERMAKAKGKQKPARRIGGVAGEYIQLVENAVYNSVPHSIAFGVTWSACMWPGVAAIADGLRGRDWTDRLK